MKRLIPLLASFALSCPAVADTTSGEALIAACAHCHGTDGNSSSGQYPSLARQNKAYIVKQLMDFKTGKRTDGQMSPMVGVLKEEDTRLLADFYSGENLVRQRGIDEELAAKGKQLAAELNCASCHQKNYRGKEEVPRLARQKRVYLVKQMTDFRDGNRTNDNGIKTEAVKNLSDEQIKVLSHYFAGM